MKLNCGAGRFNKEGYLNIDNDKSTNPDMIVNLNRDLNFFQDKQFNLIEADHVVEHLDNPFKTMKEFHRILEDDGILIIKVPHFSRGFTHPEHKRGFDVSLPLYFNKDFQGGYCGVEYKLISMRLNWFAQPYLKKITLSKPQYYFGLILGTIINSFANLSPYFCSRVWCFWVGGFEEIEFKFKKVGGKE
jgi:SAM-dependent methyltransferase